MDLNFEKTYLRCKLETAKGQQLVLTECVFGALTVCSVLNVLWSSCVSVCRLLRYAGEDAGMRPSSILSRGFSLFPHVLLHFFPPPLLFLTVPLSCKSAVRAVEQHLWCCGDILVPGKARKGTRTRCLCSFAQTDLTRARTRQTLPSPGL